ncbi:hypothetical protein SAMN04488074_103392 [Lentzea albidocapillata subsp. violacea]|uniref:ABC-type branched-chain amino acid transport system, substrate-binding protein n=1 Tax=Lentzea albidocapillata subsp. violacea TaxID=128104 RepID=A0A1G8X6H1_9PSEU|nr:hypothetical protein SAMN04488074_103392 [Lentzea albidocapillata subsp. violacea]
MTGSRPEPVFPGLNQLLEVIRGLCDRPGFFYRSPTEEVVGDQPLPLLYVESEASPTDFLRALEAKLDTGVPGIPHAYVDVSAVAAEVDKRWPPKSRETPPLLPLLDELSFRLSQIHIGTERLTRFDHYRLADWLTGKKLPSKPGRQDDRASVIELLRSWTGRTGQDGEAVNRAVDAFIPGLVTRLGLGLVAWVGTKLGFRWLAKRVPGLARESKWFMKGQNFALPNHSIEFLGFAERLTLGRREAESEKQIKLLLVHAFLEDLRIAYRRRGRFLPRRVGWRRTAYVPVLLDGVNESNGGWELLQLINEVRNRTGELDPLLVIAASSARPALSETFKTRPWRAENAVEALATWRQELPGKRQQLDVAARYLMIKLPFPDPERVTWLGAPVFRAAPVRWLAKSRRLELIISAMVLLLLVPGFTKVQANIEANCSIVGSAISPGVSTRLMDVDGHLECVGYSDNDNQVFGSNERLRWTQQAVFAQNAVAERLHEDAPGRPLVSLLYFSSLTHRDANPDADHSRAEELEGMLLKQRQQNDRSRSEPLLRIVIANGGATMKKAPEVLRDMLTPLLERDPSIIGVIGLDRSVAETQAVITELGALGVPTVGTTLTEASLPSKSATYFQLIPGNVRQADLVQRYAQHLGVSKVTIYHPPLGKNDIYLTDLVDVLGKHLAAASVNAQAVPWVNSPQELRSQCAEDHSSEMAFFAGREEDFGEFLRAVGRDCYDKSRLPRIVADDAIIRFIAQKASRTHDSLAGMRVSYVSMAGLIVLAGKDCVQGKPDPTKVRGGQPLDAFCAGYSRLAKEIQETPLAPEDKPAKPWPGEHMGVAYDATGLFLDAVRNAQKRLGNQPGRTPQRGAIGGELRELNSHGATGRTDFAASRVGERRNFTILELKNIHDFEEQPTCVFATGDLYSTDSPKLANGCPA